MKTALIICLALLLPALASAQKHPGAQAFIDRAATEHELDPAMVAAMLEQAEFKQSIADAIARPAEGKDWYEYRPIFITDQRIAEGIEFWQKNADLIAAASEKYQVDPQFIVAIIGVETFYGRITGNFRVLDALATLSFHYPSDRTRDRSDFFAGELMEFFLLSGEEKLPLDEITGSYAGAMGMGQFIPSSYRAYSVDFDDDGSRDLWRSTADGIGSVANYLHVHGWEMGGPVARRSKATADADFSLVEGRKYKPDLTVLQLHQKGFASAPDVDPGRQAAMVSLQQKDHKEYWMVFQNFYTITRYNRSTLYAMAVYQLSEALREGMETAQ